MTRFRLRVPATSANLGPGFDCLGLAVTIYLTLDCQPADRFQLTLSGQGAGELPTDDTNLIAKTLLAAAGLTSPPAVHLRIDNQIPLKRGLGSSAAATIAGLVAGYIIGGSDPADLPTEDLLRHANRFEGHLDNAAAALLGGLVVSGVEDQRPIAIRLPWPDDLRLIAVIPQAEIETRKARQALPKTIDHGAAVMTTGWLARLLASLQSGDYRALKSAFQDRLHQPYRLPLVPGLDGALRALTDHPATLGAWLSGSGPTLLAVGTGDADLTSAATAANTALERAGTSSVLQSIEADDQGLDCQAIDHTTPAIRAT